MPTNLNLEPQAHVGSTGHRWTFRERKEVARPTWWWVSAGVVAAAIVAYALFTGNFLFAIIIVLAGALFVAETKRTPRRLTCQLTSTGVVVGKKFWRWSELTNFWIAYRPPEVMNLYLVPKGSLDPRVSIPLGETNPVAVRNHLRKFLSEDLEREDEPTSEALARLLKLE